MNNSNNRIINILKHVTVAIFTLLISVSVVSTLIFSDAYAAKKVTDSKASKKTEKSVEEPNIETGSAAVLCASTSQLVYGIREERKLSPGNLTKLVTAMIVIDNVNNPNEYKNIIEFSEQNKAADPGLKKYKQMTVAKLLSYMLTSGSDVAAELLAEYSSSSMDIFVNEMNSRVLGMGLMDTQFTNCTGAYNEMQYSTPYDMAVVTQYALRYQRLREIIEDTKSDVYYTYVIGQINGNMTSPSVEAQSVCIASKDGLDIVVVLLGEDELKRQTDTEALLKYGMKMADANTIIKEGEKVGRVSVKHGDKTKVACYTKTKGYAYIPPEGTSSLVSTEVYLYEDITAPLAKGTKVGEYRIYVADDLKGTVDLVTHQEVGIGWFPSYVYISNFTTILLLIIVLLILLLILRIINVKKTRKKKKALLRQKKIEEIARQQLELEEDRKRRGWTYH